MELLWSIFDDSNNPVTGAASAIALKLRRASDGFLLDWSDLAFKPSGWANVSSNMAEVDGAFLPGMYETLVDESLWQDGYYQVVARCQSGSLVRNGIFEGLVKGGKLVDEGLHGLLSDLTDEAFGRWVLDAAAGTLTLYREDGVAVLKKFNLGAASGPCPAYISRTPA